MEKVLNFENVTRVILAVNFIALSYGVIGGIYFAIIG